MKMATALVAFVSHGIAEVKEVRETRQILLSGKRVAILRNGRGLPLHLRYEPVIFFKR